MPWIIFSVLLTAGAVLMTVRGVGVSTKLAGAFFAFEMLVLVVVSVVAIAKNGGHLSAAPFQWSNMTNGFRGLAAGFPLAVYLFIGWENSAALAGETGNPRRNVPRAVFLSIAMMGVGYVLFAYATLTGFHYNATVLPHQAGPVPALQLVPVCGPGHRGGRRRLQHLPQPPRPGPWGPGRLDHRRRVGHGRPAQETMSFARK